MQSELKFRVWSIEQKRYLPTVDGIWYELRPTREESLAVYRSTGWDGFVSLGHAMQWADKYLVQQWTGLKDKNGVDIYVGDFVKWFHGVVHCGRVVFTTDPFNIDLAYFGVQASKLGIFTFQYGDEYEVLTDVTPEKST